MVLSRELIAVLVMVVTAAFLLLMKALSLKEEGEPLVPATREEELRAARASALRQIEILQNPIRSRDKTGFSLQQIERLQAIVTEIDAELAG